MSPVVKGSSGNGANLIECAELEGDTVDTFGEGVTEVDAAHRLGESANLVKIVRNVKIKMFNKHWWMKENKLAKLG